MTRFTFLLALTLLIASSMASAAGQNSAGDATSGPSKARGGETKRQAQASGRRTTLVTTGNPDHALMQRIWDAWATLDPANAAPYYDKAPGDVFFDIAPMKYAGWAEYQKGAKALLAGYRSAKITVNDDKVLSNGTTGAVGTATIHALMVKKDGSNETLDMRWTAVWAKQGTNWLIIHEHVSVPLGAGQ